MSKIKNNYKCTAPGTPIPCAMLSEYKCKPNKCPFYTKIDDNTKMDNTDSSVINCVKKGDSTSITTKVSKKTSEDTKPIRRYL